MATFIDKIHEEIYEKIHAWILKQADEVPCMSRRSIDRHGIMCSLDGVFRELSERFEKDKAALTNIAPLKNRINENQDTSRIMRQLLAEWEEHSGKMNV